MKGKKVVATLQDPTDTVTADKVATALGRRFPFFDFSHDVMPALDTQGAQIPVVRAVLADGPWHIKANLRPSLDQIVRFAEGYLTCLLDSAAQSSANAAAVDAVLSEEEP